jgi:hypothetical protein
MKYNAPSVTRIWKLQIHNRWSYAYFKNVCPIQNDLLGLRLDIYGYSSKPNNHTVYLWGT